MSLTTLAYVLIPHHRTGQDGCDYHVGSVKKLGGRGWHHYIRVASTHTISFWHLLPRHVRMPFGNRSFQRPFPRLTPTLTSKGSESRDARIFGPDFFNRRERECMPSTLEHIVIPLLLGPCANDVIHVQVFAEMVSSPYSQHDHSRSVVFDSLLQVNRRKS